ncbi:MAG TPA: TolC family protein [Chthoniobacterales bacterium]
MARTALFLLICFATVIGRLRAADTRKLDAEAAQIVNNIRLLEPGLPDPNRYPAAVAPGPLSIQRAVEIALANNLSLLMVRDGVRSLALDLQTSRRDFRPKFRAGASLFTTQSSVVVGNDQFSSQNTNASQTVGVTQRFPFGGEISLDAGAAYNSGSDDSGSYSPSGAVSLRLPVLRGFGIDQNAESIVQRKRNVLYALRSLKLQEQDVAIATIESFLDLLSQQQRIRLLAARLKGAELLHRRSVTFFAVGRESEFEMVRAAQEELRAKRDLEAAEAQLENQKDSFKILVNLPADYPLEPAPYLPPDFPLPPNADAAIVLALHRRADLRTIADIVADKQRGLKFARNDLKPDLDLRASAATSSWSSNNSSAVSQDYSAGIVFSLPLERTRENVNLYDAFQDLAQSQREERYARETNAAAIRGAIRVLQNIDTSLIIQDQIVDSSRRKERLAEIRLAYGEAANRDLIDAQNDVLGDQNYRLDLQQDRYVGFLRLQRALGTFDIAQLLPATSQP